MSRATDYRGFRHPQKIRDKILLCLTESIIPLTPKEISNKTGKNPNSTSPELSRLIKSGLLVRDFRGAYSINPTYGVSTPPRVQNLRVMCEEVPIIQSDKVILSLGDFSEFNLKINISFGFKRGKISWTVGAPLGLDLYGFLLCRALVESECQVRNYEVTEWTITSLEFLFDFDGLKLEGLKSMTYKNLENDLEKIYAKKEGVRRELKISGQIPLESLLTLLRGGPVNYYSAKQIHLLSHEIEKLIMVTKFTNKTLMDVLHLVRHTSLVQQHDRE